MLSYKAVREGLSKEVTCEKRPEGNEGSDSKISDGACESEGTGVAKVLWEGMAGALSGMTAAGTRSGMKTLNSEDLQVIVRVLASPLEEKGRC